MQVSYIKEGFTFKAKVGDNLIGMKIAIKLTKIDHFE